MKTVPSVYILLMNSIHLSLSTQVVWGAVFGKHTVDTHIEIRNRLDGWMDGWIHDIKAHFRAVALPPPNHHNFRKLVGGGGGIITHRSTYLDTKYTYIIMSVFCCNKHFIYTYNTYITNTIEKNALK